MAAFTAWALLALGTTACAVDTGESGGEESPGDYDIYAGDIVDIFEDAHDSADPSDVAESLNEPMGFDGESEWEPDPVPWMDPKKNEQDDEQSEEDKDEP